MKKMKKQITISKHKNRVEVHVYNLTAYDAVVLLAQSAVDTLADNIMPDADNDLVIYDFCDAVKKALTKRLKGVTE